MTQVKSQTIAVEHIRISSERAFAEVRRKLESTVPKLDTGIFEALSSGDQRRAKDYEENGPRLSIFLEPVEERHRLHPTHEGPILQQQ